MSSFTCHLELVLPDVVVLEPVVFPLQVHPHHHPQLHVRHHHVLKADQGIFDGEEFSKEKKLF